MFCSFGPNSDIDYARCGEVHLKHTLRNRPLSRTTPSELLTSSHVPCFLPGKVFQRGIPHLLYQCFMLHMPSDKEVYFLYGLWPNPSAAWGVNKPIGLNLRQVSYTGLTAQRTGDPWVTGTKNKLPSEDCIGWEQPMQTDKGTKLYKTGTVQGLALRSPTPAWWSKHLQVGLHVYFDPPGRGRDVQWRWYVSHKVNIRRFSGPHSMLSHHSSKNKHFQATKNNNKE